MVRLWWGHLFSLPAVDRTYCEHPHVLGFEGREGPRWSELRHGSTVWTAAVPLSPLWFTKVLHALPGMQNDGYGLDGVNHTWRRKKTLGLHATAGYIHSSMWIQLYPIVSRDIRPYRCDDEHQSLENYWQHESVLVDTRFEDVLSCFCSNVEVVFTSTTNQEQMDWSILSTLDRKQFCVLSNLDFLNVACVWSSTQECVRSSHDILDSNILWKLNTYPSWLPWGTRPMFQLSLASPAHFPCA